MLPGNVMPKGQFEEMVGEGSKEQWKGMGKGGFGRRERSGKVGWEVCASLVELYEIWMFS